MLENVKITTGGGELEKDDKKLLFWNVAGLMNKDKDFWHYIKGFDFISMCETWLEEKGWDNFKGRLPNSHEWVCSFAMKEKKKGELGEVLL